MVAGCRHSVASYLDAIIAANSSSACIDRIESQALFQDAQACTVRTVGNDVIQHLYTQIAGVPNPNRNVKDPRFIARGYFRTFFKKDHPTFSEGQFFAQGANACLNFDDVQTDRRIICTPDSEKKPEDQVVKMHVQSIHWCDSDETGVPYHDLAIHAAYTSLDETANWRTLLRNETGKPLIATQTALDMIKRNLPYPEVVEHAIRLGVESNQDPWAISDFATKVLNLLVAERGIDEAAKLLHAKTLSTYVRDRFDQLPNVVYREHFEGKHGKTFFSFSVNNRSKAQLANDWRNSTDPAKLGYYNDGIGYGHGVFNDITLIGGAWTVVPFAAKVGWVAVTGGLAAAGAVIAAAPVSVVVGAIALTVGLISVAGVYLWSRYKAEEAHEQQYSRTVDAFETERPLFD